LKRNVLTIAVGKQLYVDMAVMLARSFLLWNSGNGIEFHIVTDQPQFVPDDLKKKVNVNTIAEGGLPAGFSSKLYLDELAPEGQTLFIDSDCLIFGDLNSLFGRFQGKAVSVIGGYISNGEWFGDIASVCKKFEISRMPKFNGGLYYLEKGDKATDVYNTARELEKSYDDIGFVRLRGRPNDEVLMAVAMQLHHQKPLDDDGTVMSDPQACPGKYHIDIISGKRLLVNPPYPHPQHQAWYPFEKVSPLIVHFLGYYTQHYPYRREVYRLQKNSNGKLNLITELGAKFTIEYPGRLKTGLKNTLRPLYHSMFGFRTIKTSQRI
jgi:hypothetical protein